MRLGLLRWLPSPASSRTRPARTPAVAAARCLHLSSSRLARAAPRVRQREREREHAQALDRRQKQSNPNLPDELAGMRQWAPEGPRSVEKALNAVSTNTPAALSRPQLDALMDGIDDVARLESKCLRALIAFFAFWEPRVTIDASSAAYKAMAEHVNKAMEEWDLSVLHVLQATRIMNRQRILHKTVIFLLLQCVKHGSAEAAIELGISTVTNATGPDGPRRVRTISLIWTIIGPAIVKLRDMGDPRAASLLATVAAFTESPEQVLTRWETAVKLNRERPTSSETRLPETRHLDQPWFDHALHVAQVYEKEAGMDAIQKALFEDDADAYEAYASSLKLEIPNASTKPLVLLDYLNAATKAAAAGSFRAMLLLGHHFANDPLDKRLVRLVDRADRPTPGFLSSLLTRSNKSSPDEEEAEHEGQDRWEMDYPPLTPTEMNIARYVVSFRTPNERVGAALQWYDIAASKGHLEAARRTAELCSRQYIFEKGNISRDQEHLSEQHIDRSRGDVESEHFDPDKVVEGLMKTVELRLCKMYPDRWANYQANTSQAVIAFNLETIEEDYEYALALADEHGVDILVETADGPAYRKHESKDKEGRPRGGLHEVNCPGNAHSLEELFRYLEQKAVELEESREAAEARVRPR